MIDKAKNETAVQSSAVRVFALLGLLLPVMWIVPAASALEFQCEVPGDIRYLRVDIPGQENLCEVSVKYEFTGEHKVLWHADNDTLFCSARAYELRDKYVNTWNFDCATWPDSDGIDQLSASQRAILDTQLKILIEQGQNSNPTFKVNAVKAVASTLLDAQPGTLALQFFLSTGDLTQVIINETGTWKVFATFDDLAKHVTSNVPLNAALIDSITDSGALAISTTVQNNPELRCLGKQVLMVENGNRLSPRTPHRYVCNPSPLSAADPG